MYIKASIKMIIFIIVRMEGICHLSLYPIKLYNTLYSNLQYLNWYGDAIGIRKIRKDWIDDEIPSLNK